jgi:hypothetical protein
MTARPHPNDIQKSLCDLAEQIASQSFGARLDYSVNSVREVERILGAMHDEFRKTGSDDGMRGVALEFSAYLVSVIQRHFGPAKWERDCPSFGEDAFPLLWNEGTIYPYAWCQKRIFDGPADNVWIKFYTIVIGEEPPSRPWWKFW